MINKRYFVFGLVMLGLTMHLQSQIKRANKKFDKYLYAEAIPLYLKYLKKDDKDWQAIERLGDSYRLINDSKEATRWYAKAVLNKEGRPENNLYLGQALMNNREWEKALPWLQKYQEAKPEDPIGNATLQSARTYQSFMRDSARYSVVHLDINSEESDFGTAFWGDENVLFASARRSASFIFGWTGRPFLDLYQASVEGMELAEPENLKGRVNSRYHEGGQTFGPKRDVMFFSRNNYYRGKAGQSKDGVILLRTFRADLVNGRWKKIRGIPFNSDEYSVGHPALSPDGKKLYFSSDMPGGEGGTDLYVVELDIENETWGTPVNLGPKVNTKGNEMFPWISPEGELFFASNGHEGLGGLDIFQVSGLGTSAEKMMNLGYPINSSKDDFALIFDSKKGKGFFSSNREGGMGDDDIYGFSKKKVLRGIVVDAGTGEPIQDARFELYSKNKFITLSRTDIDGQSLISLDKMQDLHASASKEGYKEAGEPVLWQDMSPSGELTIRIPLEKIESECNSEYTLLGTVQNNEGKLLPGTKVKILTREYIVVADENGEFTADLSPNQDYQVMVDDPRRKNKVYDISTKGLPNGSEIPVNINLNDIDSGRVFYIIYYNFDKHDIRPEDARPELDRVVRFMTKNPGVKVKLTSHTDSRASKSYNERLSKNRAIEAYTYITARGVEKDRLSYDWKGESELVNECADGVECSEPEHQLNRRTEFRIQGYYTLPSQK